MHPLTIENKQCYIIGYFNINLLNYDHHVETHDYVGTMFSNSLISQITKPIRIIPTTATILDNIYSNYILGEYNQLHGILCTDISDHLPIFLLTKLNNDITDDVTRPEYIIIKPLSYSKVLYILYAGMIFVHLKIPKQDIQLFHF